MGFVSLVLVAGGPPRDELVQALALPRGDGGIQPLRFVPHLAVEQVNIPLLVVAALAAVDDYSPRIDPAFPPPRLVDADQISHFVPEGDTVRGRTK